MALKRAEEKRLGDEYNSQTRPDARQAEQYRERFRRLREDRAAIQAHVDALRPRSTAQHVWAWFTDT